MSVTQPGFDWVINKCGILVINKYACDDVHQIGALYGTTFHIKEEIFESLIL